MDNVKGIVNSVEVSNALTTSHNLATIKISQASSTKELGLRFNIPTDGYLGDMTSGVDVETATLAV